jgi:predicted Fe-Mo cluster-binding NifX family protein
MPERRHMKICIPSEQDLGLESRAYSHFGSAPYFILYDTDTGTLMVHRNADEPHVHGACQPLKALVAEPVDAVIVGGIGARAIDALNRMGIRVYRSVPGTVKENIDQFTKSELAEITADAACGQHRHGCE